MELSIGVKTNGGIFKANVDRLVREAVYEEAIEKIGQRWLRGGRGAGVRNNALTLANGELEAELLSTANHPRSTGAAMTRKKIGQAKSMAPRVLNKAANRVVAELGGA